MESFPEDHELVGFFESEPEVTDRDVPWFYNRLTFRTTRGSHSVVCEIEPGYRQIDLTWRNAGKEMASFALREIRALRVMGSPGEEYMTVVFRGDELMDFVLYLKPDIRIEWGNMEAQ